VNRFNPNTLINDITFKRVFDDAVKSIEQQLAFDEALLSRAFAEAVIAGDFLRLVATDGRRGYIYVPYEGVDSLRSENSRLRELCEKNGISTRQDHDP